MQFTIFTLLIMQLIYPLSFAQLIVSKFLLGVTVVQREIEDNN